MLMFASAFAVIMILWDELRARIPMAFNGRSSRCRLWLDDVVSHYHSCSTCPPRCCEGGVTAAFVMYSYGSRDFSRSPFIAVSPAFESRMSPSGYIHDHDGVHGCCCRGLLGFQGFLCMISNLVLSPNPHESTWGSPSVEACVGLHGEFERRCDSSCL